ncbi:MAG: acetyl/propionyl/methylcrotonyl-CoA carboxylase subunit alpha [Rhodospirillaceae bacterium]|nr:acetyl/propionyl/methylcrotonyl-CoA carboxylase subunit alpha [Rhodospirillaceae bacterium]
MFNTILIANRGEIACRVIRTARQLGIKTVAVYSEADQNALHVDMASDAVFIGPPMAAESYLRIDAIMEAIEETGADAVHPGYGFLSENPEFAERLDAAGITFIGPKPDAMRVMGDKIESKLFADKAGVPTVPGHAEPVKSAADAKKIAKQIGYPVILKASAGGGGKGMRMVESPAEIEEGLRASTAEAESSFGDGRVFVEKFITNPRHIEIQVLADSHGNCVHLGERECSIQRRHQKVIEEAPSPFVDEAMRAEMGAQAVTLAKAVNYQSAGTVEFIVDSDKNFFFLEMNTRLQVEHPVTELVTGLDLVEQMIKVAAGEELEFDQDGVNINGWAMESRLYAEDPTRGFLPAIGRLVEYREPVTGVFGTSKNVRVDGGVNEGDEITRFYDPMIAKLITNGETRDEAIKHMQRALEEYYVRGVGNNLGFLSAVMAHPRFIEGNITTNFIAEEFGEKFIPEETAHEDFGMLAAIAAMMHRREIERDNQITGRAKSGSVLSREQFAYGNEWMAMINGESHPIRIAVSDNQKVEIHAGGQNYMIDSEWRPGRSLFTGSVNDEEICMQVERTSTGFRVRHAGYQGEIRIMSSLAAELLNRMPAKKAADTSKQLISPMPGLLVSVEVEVGQEVESGEALAVVEAMKMENQLFAERAGVVGKIYLEPGDSLEVGQLILELE